MVGFRTVSYRTMLYTDMMRVRGGVISRGTCTSVNGPMNFMIGHCIDV
jgi:hypothetical protein